MVYIILFIPIFNDRFVILLFSIHKFLLYCIFGMIIFQAQYLHNIIGTCEIKWILSLIYIALYNPISIFLFCFLLFLREPTYKRELRKLTSAIHVHPWLTSPSIAVMPGRAITSPSYLLQGAQLKYGWR